MEPSDFVYKNTLKMALDSGLSNAVATGCASKALQRYKQGRYKKIDAMMKEEIAAAKKVAK